ncbi:hypothetical protein C1M51_02800 [Methylibium sp. Pch-M]|uniref:hypothetical protein n=1 Tax=Methylibium sp. Pch-M TaxID=2082386 RepID=UPI0010136AC2|nr:hypothetical protein [Methylibium sp. Pch-M]QAZ38434.1 hypothetical protein C1M51_02800 [Methylibium sp. Pch-M]
MARTKAPEPVQVDLQEARVLLGHAARMFGVFQHAGRVCNALIEAERVAAANVAAGEAAAKELAGLQTKLQSTRDAIAAAQAEQAEKLRAYEVEEGEAKSRLKALRAEADAAVATLLEQRG